MTTRFYLLITLLLLILTFSLSQAGSSYQSAGAFVPGGGAPPSAGKISDNNSPLPQDRVNLPKQDTNQGTKPGKTQSGNQGAIFDRWGN